MLQVSIFEASTFHDAPKESVRRVLGTDGEGGESGYVRNSHNAIMVAPLRDGYRISSFQINKLGIGSAIEQ